MTDNDQALLHWVDRLSQEDLPLFAHTARSIASLSENSDASIAEMAESILSDSAMTARVLRMANSVFFNQTSKPITTVSKAILVIGFNGVRNIALSIALIDTILSGIRHDRAIQEMIRAYHAAIQAKGLALQENLDNQKVEEIFIATLLQRFGSLTFWCFSYGFAEALDFEYSMHKTSEEAEQQILGFTLQELTKEITGRWHLSSLSPNALPEEGERDAKQSIHHPSQYVTAGYDISLAAEQGWESAQMETVVNHLSKTLNKPKADISLAIRTQAAQALEALHMMGIPNAASIIPHCSQINAQPSVKENTKVSTNQIELQMSMLMDLTSMLFTQPDVNLILNTTLEGIFRGLLMDRVILAWTNPKTNSLKAKHVMGGHKSILMERFDFSLASKEENLLTHAFDEKKPIFLNKKYRFKHSTLISKDIKRCIGDNDAFVMPILVKHQPRGLMYADKAITKRALTEKEFQTFQHFCEHINIAFKMLHH